jgi:hypothetical protein
MPALGQRPLDAIRARVYEALFYALAVIWHTICR